MTPTQRSRSLLADEGYLITWKVECYDSFSKRYHDLYGMFDIEAIHTQTGKIIWVQTTTASNMSARKTKIIEHDNYELVKPAIINGHATIEVHGWAKRGPRGKRKTWQCRRVIVT